MATKDKLMRLILDVRARAEIQQTRSAPKHSPLFLAQLRAHMNDTVRPKRRLVIQIRTQQLDEFPEPVKILHVKSDSGV
jgi:hypothetical protein